jgi:hypothetical protein
VEKKERKDPPPAQKAHLIDAEAPAKRRAAAKRRAVARVLDLGPSTAPDGSDSSREPLKR